jgi:hypothetical protein
MDAFLGLLCTAVSVLICLEIAFFLCSDKWVAMFEWVEKYWWWRWKWWNKK